MKKLEKKNKFDRIRDSFFMSTPKELEKESPTKSCLECGTPFKATRSDKVYCCRTCKEKAHKKRLKEELSTSLYYSNEEIKILRSHKYIRTVTKDKYSSVYFTDSFYTKAYLHICKGGSYKDIEELFDFPKFLIENRTNKDYLVEHLKCKIYDKPYKAGLPAYLHRWTESNELEKFNTLLLSAGPIEDIFSGVNNYVSAHSIAKKMSTVTKDGFIKMDIYAYLFYLYEQEILDISLSADETEVLYALTEKGKEYFSNIVPNKKVEKEIILEKLKSLKGIHDISLGKTSYYKVALKADFKEYLYNSCFDEFLNNGEVDLKRSIDKYLIDYEISEEGSCTITLEDLSILGKSTLEDKFNYVILLGFEYPSLGYMKQYLKNREGLFNRVVAALYSSKFTATKLEEDILDIVKDSPVFNDYYRDIPNFLLQLALYECYRKGFLYRKLINSDSEDRYKDVKYKKTRELSKYAKSKEVYKYWADEITEEAEPVEVHTSTNEPKETTIGKILGKIKSVFKKPEETRRVFEDLL